jgi:hypothetical protein
MKYNLFLVAPVLVTVFNMAFAIFLNHRHAHAIPSSEPAQWMRNQNLQQQGMF